MDCRNIIALPVWSLCLTVATVGAGAGQGVASGDAAALPAYPEGTALTVEKAKAVVDALESIWPQIQVWAMPRIAAAGGIDGAPAALSPGPEWLLQNWESMTHSVPGIERAAVEHGMTEDQWEWAGRAVLRTYMAILRGQEAATAGRGMDAAQKSLIDNPHIPEDQRQRLLQMMREAQREILELSREPTADKVAVEPLLPRLNKLFAKSRRAKTEQPETAE